VVERDVGAAFGQAGPVQPEQRSLGSGGSEIDADQQRSYHPVMIAYWRRTALVNAEGAALTPVLVFVIILSLQELEPE
jgi:hypothetical protein